MYIENKFIRKQLSIWMLFMFFLVSIIIIIGGLTRLTDSGLSITEWELFKGFIPPLNHEQMELYFELYKQIPEFKMQNFSMSLSEFKVIFWWEWSHRFIARIIGILYLIPLIYFTYILGFKKVKYLYLIFFLICFQGFIGWFMVSSGLENRVDVSHFRLSIHLLFAFLILSLLLWNYLNVRVEKNISIKLNPFLPLFFLILIFFQKKQKFIIPGILSSLFLILYSTFRFIAEYFRAPDEQIGYLIFNLTMGQLISFVFFVLGFILYYFINYNEKKT